MAPSLAAQQALGQIYDARPFVKGCIKSETGVLRRVILHRPGRELERVVPDNRGELLFDDIPWLPGAQREHDVLAGILRRHGVEVIYADQLLAAALEDSAGSAQLVAAALDRTRIGPALIRTCADYLASLPAARLADILVHGLCLDELPEAPRRTLLHCVRPAERFLIEPLPNLMFMRDSLSWVGHQVSVNRFAKEARQRESHLLSVVLDDGVPRLWPEGTAPATIEGGDILVAGESCILIGVGERTTPAAAEFLAAGLLRSRQAHTVFAVFLPRARQTMHLDTVLTMVAPDTFLSSTWHLDQCETFQLSRDRDGSVRADAVPRLTDALARALHVPAIRVVPIGGDRFTQYREQWSDAANVLALAPGTVIAYDRNHRANESLDRAGIDVITIPSAELSRGRGGPHCLSCPVLRDDLG